MTTHIFSELFPRPMLIEQLELTSQTLLDYVSIPDNKCKILKILCFQATVFKIRGTK